MNNFLIGTINSILFLLLLVLIEYITRRKNLNKEFTRKIAHVISGLFGVVMAFVLDKWVFIAFALIFFVIISISYGIKFFSSIHNVKRKTYGEILLPLGILAAYIFSNGAKTARDVTIVRDDIIIKSVRIEQKESGGKKIGVIHLTRYGDDTKGLLDEAITKLLNDNVKAIVLDERNNPGGYITSAVDVASNWIDSGKVIVSEQFADGRKNSYNAEGTPRLKGFPTVVLINEGSASASEIVAGALKDYGLATLVGKKSFGKGSVQEMTDLPGGTSIKVTIAKWLTPNGYNINHEGIKADVEVDISQSDVEAGQDPQLDKAIETAAAKI